MGPFPVLSQADGNGMEGSSRVLYCAPVNLIPSCSYPYYSFSLFSISSDLNGLIFLCQGSIRSILLVCIRNKTCQV